MGKTLDDVRNMDTEKYDWYRCIECGEPEILEKKWFLKKVMQYKKMCIDCRNKEEKRQSKMLSKKKRTEKKKAE